MRFICLVLCLLSVTIGVCAQESEAVLDTPSGRLYGTLSLPPDAEQPPVVLIVAGSGPTDRNGNNPGLWTDTYKILADSLAARGIASLRYDKRGIGRSIVPDLREEDMRFETGIDDAAAWIAWLGKRGTFSRIVVAGHSEGALVGMVAAGRGGVNGMITLAGAGYPMDEVLKWQLTRLPVNVMLDSYTILDKLKAGNTVNDIPQFLYGLFRPSVQPYLISCMRYDPARCAADLGCPLLIIQGDKDIQVTTDNGKALLRAVPAAKYVQLRGMAHTLKCSDTTDEQRQMRTVYSDPSLPLHPQLVPAIADFIGNLGCGDKTSTNRMK